MDRTRDMSWTARLVAAAGVIVFGVLLLGSQPATAAPTAPVVPTEISQPTAQTLPPKPKPCLENAKCLPPTLEPCFVKPGESCTPPTLDPSEPQTPTSEPTRPSKPATPTRVTEPTRPATPTDPPAGIPTPNRIDTGGGTGGTGPHTPTWLFWAVPGLALLILGAGLSGWWLARSEVRR